jgi:hypothetical protein
MPLLSPRKRSLRVHSQAAKRWSVLLLMTHSAEAPTTASYCSRPYRTDREQQQRGRSATFNRSRRNRLPLDNSGMDRNAAQRPARNVAALKKEGQGRPHQAASIAAIDLGANGLPRSLTCPAAASAALI